MRNVEQQRFWDAMAPEWIAAQPDLEPTSAWFGDEAMQRVAAEPGHYVVDIGCGTGETTVALAHAVGPNGRAVGIDISEGMVSEARRRAAERADANVTFVVADPEEGPVAEGADAAFSRFGIMFFTDPARAFGNICRSLRSGGRFAAVAWQSVFSNEWLLLPGMSAMTVTGSLPPMPAEDEPGPFSLADADKFGAVLAAAGFTAVDVTSLEHELVVTRDDVDAFVRRSLAVGAAREAIRASGDDPAVAREIADQLRKDMLERMGAEPRTQLKAAAWLATAQRP